MHGSVYAKVKQQQQHTYCFYILCLSHALMTGLTVFIVFLPHHTFWGKQKCEYQSFSQLELERRSMIWIENVIKIFLYSILFYFIFFFFVSVLLFPYPHCVSFFEGIQDSFHLDFCHDFVMLLTVFFFFFPHFFPSFFFLFSSST